MMKLALVLALNLLWHSSFADDDMLIWKNDWVACKASSECITFKSCCEWESVARVHIKEVQAFEADQCTLKECGFQGDRNKMPASECVKNRCTLVKINLKNKS